MDERPRRLPWLCRGRRVCADCPDDRHQPPYKPFGLPHHERLHVETNPAHRIVWWCDDHRAYDCRRKTPVSGHGGRRQGAGAPRGNLNALRHGRRSQDDHLRQLLARLPSDVRADLLPYLRAAGLRTIKRRLAWLQADRRYESPNVVPFRPPTATATTTTHAAQSSGDPTPAPLQALILRMTGWGFFGAAAFARAHSPAAPEIARVLDYFDQDGAEGARSPGALLRSIIHEEIADQDGRQRRCPYCPWTGAIGKERSS